jgi:hypothetical protein
MQFWYTMVESLQEGIAKMGLWPAHRHPISVEKQFMPPPWNS